MNEARALWYTAPGAVEIRPVPLDDPGDGQVLVRTTYSGISAGTELLAYRGQLDPDMPLDETIGALGGTFRHPFRYGYSCVGVVEVSRSALEPGTPVFAFHPHQDRFVVDAAAAITLGGIDHRQATLLPLVETALQITLDAGEVLLQPVLVFGLGAVGTLTALLLQRAGARPVGVEPLAWRRELAENLGIPTLAPDQLPGGVAPVPLIVEASGNPAAAAAALPLLAHEGTLLVASWHGTKEVPLPLGQHFHRRRLTIRSTQVSTIPARLSWWWTPERRRDAVVGLLGELPLAALASHTFPFEEASAAFAALDQGCSGLTHVALGYG